VFYHLSAYGPPGRGFYLLTYLSIYLSIYLSFLRKSLCIWPSLALNSQILQPEPSKVKITLVWLIFIFSMVPKKKRRKIFCDKWKQYEIQVDTISKVLLEPSYLTHFHVTHDCSCHAAA
jgi:hypothetical protein